MKPQRYNGQRKGAMSNMSNKYNVLKLENQICFPLYVCEKEIVRAYKPHLDEIGLTYTQYITMMVMWEHRELRVKEVGKRLYLDSGTLTPVLKKLEEKGFVERKRSDADERDVIVTLTKSGEALKNKAVHIHEKLGGCIALKSQKAKALYELLYEVIRQLTENQKEEPI